MRTNKTCFVRGRICPEHRVRVKPYQVICEINEDAKKIITIQCLDCAASAGGCKHAIAFLMWLHRRTEEPAPTTIACYWKKPVLSQIGGNIKFIKAVDIGKRKKRSHKNVPDCQGFLEEVVKNIKDHDIDYICPLTVHNRQLTTNVVTKLSIHRMFLDFLDTEMQHSAENFITFCCDGITEEDIENASELSYDQSETSSWYELRYGRITASKLYDAAACKTADGVLTKQIMGVAKTFQSAQMKRGIDLEKLVIVELEKQFSINVKRSGFIVLKKYGILGASPDGVTEDSVIEIKCPASESAVSRYITSSGEVTKRFQAQINLQMLAKKVTRGIFCVAAPDFETSKKITAVQVKYDSEFTEHIINSAIEFWKSNIFPLLLDSYK